MSDTQAVLKTLLQDAVGHHNAVTESQLVDATGLSKSTLRSEIETLRDKRAVPIQNFRDGKGYFIPSDEEEFKEQISRWNKQIQQKRTRIENHIEAWNSFDRDSVADDVLTPTYQCANCGATVEKQDAKHPKEFDENGPLCKGCYGNLLLSKR